MRKAMLILSLITFLTSCSSVESYNQHLNDLKSEQELKDDIDYSYKKLKKLQPNLYWYISKKELDFKFDSLKNTINKPMTAFAFYKKLTPVVNAVRQGHMTVYPNTRKLTKKEVKILEKQGTGPFSQFDFEVLDNKLYVVKNKSYDKSIQPGTEVIAVNNQKVSDLFKQYEHLFTSDGFNTSYKKAKLAKSFSTYYTNENGLQDSIKYNFKYNDSYETVYIKRKVTDSLNTTVVNAKKTSVATDKKKRKAGEKKKSVFGYNAITKLYNRNLKFMESDSSIAIMKINNFSIGNYKTFYKESFKKIKNYNTKTLIIDLRDNPGGRLSEIADLYGYLTDSTTAFTDKSEVATKTSLFKADYLRGNAIGTKIIRGIVAPLYYSYILISVKKENGKYYYRSSYSSSRSGKKRDKKGTFKGKIYVLINGGSFSASCILSSNLKATKRAVFVGDETGGAYNGTVAGAMPLIQLPNTKLNIRVGLMLIAPYYKTDAADGRGIFPDVAITPTLEDRIQGNDPEMNWVIDDIKRTDLKVTTIKN
jgi:C-terminal processing protease CtpA/Prc